MTEFEDREVFKDFGVPGTIDDGFGNSWGTCGPACQLSIVRPGKVQCPLCDPSYDFDPDNTEMVEKDNALWIIQCLMEEIEELKAK